MSNDDSAGGGNPEQINYVAIALSVLAILASAGSCVQAGQANSMAKEQYREAVYRDSVYRRAENCLAFSAHYYDRLPSDNSDNNQEKGAAYFNISKGLSLCAANNDVSAIDACVEELARGLNIESAAGFGC